MAGFFDKVKSGITSTAMEATIRSKEAIESQQVKLKIGELNGQRQKVLAEVGEAVLEMHRNGTFDQGALGEQCLAAIAIEEQITEKEAELEAIHQRAEAALAEQRAAAGAPGAAPGAAGGGFCASCGTPLKGAKFCPNCGTRVS